MTPTDNRTLAAAASQDPVDALPASLADLHCYTETSGVITTTMFDVPGGTYYTSSLKPPLRSCSFSNTKLPGKANPPP